MKFLAEKVVVNRANFDWNQTDFSRRFKNTATTSEFLNLWKAVTTQDDSGYTIVHGNSLPTSPELTEAGQSSPVSQVNAPSDDERPQPPSSKKRRVCQDLQNRNPLDLAIQAKRVGMSSHCSYK